MDRDNRNSVRKRARQGAGDRVIQSNGSVIAEVLSQERASESGVFGIQA